MKKTWLTILVVVIFVGFLALAFGLAIWAQRPAQIARQTVLEIDLDRGYPEYLAYQPFGAGLFETVPTLRSLVETLDRAADDDRVVGIVANIGSAPMGLASIQEVRDAVVRFRESGKVAIAYADTFGEWRPANSAFYLASAFERVYLQPSGDVSLTGLLYESVFYRGLFEKLDVVPRMGQRYEYKNAVNTYTEEEFTEAHREALQRLADSRFEQIVNGIAEGRGLSAEDVRSASDRSPLLGVEAVEAGLVDELAYRDGVYGALEERFDDADFVPLSRYMKEERSTSWTGVTLTGGEVALIYGVGAVVRGESGYDPLFGQQNMGADSVARAFRQAIDDDEVEAIIFRISSPGGSYVASDTIWRETIRARDAGKPVIVSMGDVAASGGYFVAAAADAIVAQPATVTGSIGVYGGKLFSRGAWSKAGISYDDVAVGARSRIWSANHDFSEGDWQRIEASLDRIYEDFTAKVAEGRSMTQEQVHEVARGRVWTGEDALERGLVDELGGLDVALARVRQMLGRDEDAELQMQQYPRAKSPFELFSEGSWLRATRQLVGLARLADRLKPAAEIGRELGWIERPPAPLELPIPLIDPEAGS